MEIYKFREDEKVGLFNKTRSGVAYAYRGGSTSRETSIDDVSQIWWVRFPTDPDFEITFLTTDSKRFEIEEGRRRWEGKGREEEEGERKGEELGVNVKGMQFGYDPQAAPLFFDFDLEIEPGSRCLLLGANGFGKTTLLRILAGKHMVGGVRVIGRSAFHDTALVCSGDLAYLGGSWSKTVRSAGEILLQGDFSAEHMIFGGLTVEGIDADRRAKLIELLDIDLQWRMHKVSDGQRRRVQICMGLLYPFKVLLLDEVTVDLDVVARMDLLEFFKEECEQRGATIIYATHIFDGLETWATHLAYIQDGELTKAEKLSEVSELKSSRNLLSVVESWLRAEIRPVKRKSNPAAARDQKTSSSSSSPSFFSSTHMAYYR